MHLQHHAETKWIDGLPPDGADHIWIMESVDGRLWTGRWIPQQSVWGCVGFAFDGIRVIPEARVLPTPEERAFIARSLIAPATRAMENA